MLVKYIRAETFSSRAEIRSAGFTDSTPPSTRYSSSEQSKSWYAPGM